MVARENAETTGIIWNRLVKSKLGREIRDRFFDRSAGACFSICVLARQIISEGVMHLLELTQKSFVLSQFFQAGLPRKLQHPDGIMIGAVPQIRIEMSKEAARGWLPCPPKIKSHLTQRFERRGQSRDYVINLKRGHGRNAMGM